jgi:hypothetical protein
MTGKQFVPMHKCERCNDHNIYEFHSDYCTCSLFIVSLANNEQHEVYAHDSKLAALKYAESSNIDNDNYLLKSTIVVTVNGEDFAIGAEPKINYFANKVTVSDD